MPIRVTVPATVLPLSLTTALRQLRALEQDADMVNLWIETATEAVENYTGRSLVTKGYTLEVPRWPRNRGHWGIQSWLSMDRHILNSPNVNLRFIELRRTPLLAVQSVQYWADGASALATLDPAAYIVDTTSQPGRVIFLDLAADLPSLAARPDAVQVAFTAGHGTLESGIPAMLRAAVIMFARNLYDNPKPMADAKLIELPYTLKHMLQNQKVHSYTEEV